MGADNLFYVKSIATYAPTIFGYIISVLAIVGILLGAIHTRRLLRGGGRGYPLKVDLLHKPI